ncbi:hypothetical protein IVB38_34625 [Bradyrhizobium sp. 38]|uniref:hypothetical protein n=1 Tax=unclassified Bradyrhizobium TaxID=2631580 RepID=UPI001FF8316B|nr:MULTISPECIES: hypothetical protein [unclassified Bradyrhizobium]MCK1341016.1 hypothetical protein [Bradyrhizobium sp. 38]MCK1780975.1 hypothetical protein [Bradyrhizobium sp. 132]
MKTPNIRPGRVCVIEIGELVVDGRLADLVRVVGDADTTQIYLHPIDAPAFVARWAECGRSRGRLH